MTRAEKHQRWEDMRAYKAEGHTMKEVADKFGLTKATAQSICKGIAPQRPANHISHTPANKGVLKSDIEVAQFIENRHPKYEYAGNYTGCDGRVDLKCKSCGTVFNRSMISVRKQHVACPKCKQEEAKRIEQKKLEEQKRKKLILEGKQIAKEILHTKRETERELARMKRVHACPVCGVETIRPVYCCEACAKKAENKRRELKRKERLKAAMVDKDITVEGLFRRDSGKCWLCGGKCSYEDYTVRDGNFIVGDWYPSIDHVIPLSKGGEHSWDNVRLAHHRCNSKKWAKIIEP